MANHVRRTWLASGATLAAVLLLLVGLPQLFRGVSPVSAQRGRQMRRSASRDQHRSPPRPHPWAGPGPGDPASLAYVLANSGQETDLVRIMGRKSRQMVERYAASAADEPAREAFKRLGLGDRI
jgi:hypothetical protein